MEKKISKKRSSWNSGKINIYSIKTLENVQPLCTSCNSKKHTKIIKYEISMSPMQQSQPTQPIT